MRAPIVLLMALLLAFGLPATAQGKSTPDRLDKLAHRYDLTVTGKKVIGNKRRNGVAGTPKHDVLVGGRGNDVIFARDRRRDIVHCGPGKDTAVVDRNDVKIGCEVRVPPPGPHPVTPPVMFDPAIAPTGIPGAWTLVFSDEFSGSSLDLSKWRPNWLGPNDTAITKGVNSLEQNCIDPARVSVAGGNLRLSVVAQTQTCAGQTHPYSASLVESDGRFNFTYGAYEARIFLPAARDGSVANFPAFWSNGQDHPRSGEIDVVEGLGGDVAWHYHWGSDADERVNGDHIAARWGGEWHTYAAHWRPGVIDFYYDGVKVGTQDEGVADDPHYLIVNNVVSAVAGGQTVVPATMLVDYVRVWEAA